jgi:hypothetical protein
MANGMPQAAHLRGTAGELLAQRLEQKRPSPRLT